MGIDENGDIPLQDGYGVQANFGVTGSRAWRRSGLDLDYRGVFRHYSKSTFYDGTDHIFMLRYLNRVSRRWEIGLTQGLATFSRGFMLPYGSTSNYDQNFAALTGNELFDSRTSALISGGQAIYQHTARTSFGMGMNGFVVRRRSGALVGATGWTANGNWAYRLGRRSTIGADYSFNRFHFTNRFGESSVHGAGINYSRRLSRRWELALRVGGYRIETSRLVVIQLDPAIAAILGQTTGVQAFHGISYLPQYTARLTYSFQRSSVERGICPDRERWERNLSYVRHGIRVRRLHQSGDPPGVVQPGRRSGPDARPHTNARTVPVLFRLWRVEFPCGRTVRHSNPV